MALADDFTNGFAQGFSLGVRGVLGRDYKEGMNDAFIFLGSFIGLFVGAVLFAKGLKEFKRMRRIEDIPTTKAGSLAIGFVELSGKAEKGTEILRSPLTGKECMYYRDVIDQRTIDLRGRTSDWHNISDKETSVAFYIKDDTGKVWVDPKGACVDLTFFRERASSRKDGAFFQIENRRMIYTIEARDTLFIQGRADIEGREKVIKKGGPCFYISDQPEKNIRSDLKRDVFLEVYGGSALSLICLAVILFYLKIF